MKRTTLIAILCLFVTSIFAGGAAPPKHAMHDQTEQVIFQNDTVLVQVQIIDVFTPGLKVIHTSTNSGMVYAFYLPASKATEPAHYDYTFIDPCRSLKQNDLVINKIRASENNIKITLIGCSCGGAGYLCGSAIRLI